MTVGTLPVTRASRGTKKIPHAQKFIWAKPQQFQSVTAYEIFDYSQMNYNIIGETALYIYLSIDSKFWAFGVELYSVNGAYNFLRVRYIFRAAWACSVP